MTPGLFEMCNPHLLSTETLSQQIKTRLWLPVFSVDRSQLGIYYIASMFRQYKSPFYLSVDCYVKNLSPKCQRTYRNNRQGILLLRKQRMLRKTNTATPSHKVIEPDQGPAAESPAVKRSAVESPAVERKEGPERKRAKISWP